MGIREIIMTGKDARRAEKSMKAIDKKMKNLEMTKKIDECIGKLGYGIKNSKDKKKWFDICPIHDAHKLLGSWFWVTSRKKSVLSKIHCIHNSDLNDEIRNYIRNYLLKIIKKLEKLREKYI